jgi:small nuclear ribonucleoprotein (snRNP)-like protein
MQAYDGHMNLILSDVEETIMVVDVPEGVPETQGTVRVSGGRRRVWRGPDLVCAV